MIRNQEFLQLNVEQMANLLNNDDLNVSSEEHIFQALMSWIQHDTVTRRQYIGQLLGLVKLPLLTPAFLTDHVEPVIEGNRCIIFCIILPKYDFHKVLVFFSR